MVTKQKVRKRKHATIETKDHFENLLQSMCMCQMFVYKKMKPNQKRLGFNKSNMWSSSETSEKLYNASETETIILMGWYVETVETNKMINQRVESSGIEAMAMH